MTRSCRVAIVLALLFSPKQLWAHAHLKRSDPAAGARVSALSVLRFWFSERPEPAMTAVTLTDGDGRRVALGAPALSVTDPLELGVAIAGQLAPGTYTVSWTTAASDGHPSRGNFKFVVIQAVANNGVIVPPIDTGFLSTPVTASPVNDSTPQPLPGALAAEHSLVRAVEFLALLSLIGVIAFCFMVLPRATNVDAVLRGAMQKRAAVLGIAATAVLILTALGHLAMASQMVNAMAGSHLMTSTEMAMHTRWGNALRLQIVAAVVGLIGFAAALRRMRAGWLVAGIAALVISITPALSGHAGAAARLPMLMIAGDFLHVIAGGVWLGSLLCIATIGIPIAFRTQESTRWLGVASLVSAFSPIALTAAGVVVISGVFASWIHLEHLAALWQSSYGQMLLRKLVFVSIVIVVGAYNYKRIQPQLANEQGVFRLKRAATLELIAAVAVLIFTGFLTGIEP